MDQPHHRPQGATHRTSRGCWTCRLRRKKCDELRPICGTCDALQITCDYSDGKPDWMDGGAKQEAKVEEFKRSVKEQAHRRRTEKMTYYANDNGRSRNSLTNSSTPTKTHLKSASDKRSNTLKSDLKVSAPHLGTDIHPLCLDTNRDRILPSSEVVLLTFYLDHLFPFMFPFYQFSVSQGGKSWILDLMLNHLAIQQAAKCQSSYFYSFIPGAVKENDQAWEAIVIQAMECFDVLRKSLHAIHDLEIKQNLRGVVQLLATVIQVQRFEMAVFSSNSCQTHLDKALELFKLVFTNHEAQATEPSGSVGFHSIIGCLGESLSILPSQITQIPSAAQAAFTFSCTVLMFDDIVASTITQDKPQLYGYHRGLLCSISGVPPIINLEVMGCQNWALVLIAEIAVLDAWKQNSKKEGNLDVMELVHRATAIKDLLGAHLMTLEKTPIIPLAEENLTQSMLFVSDNDQNRDRSLRQTSLVTRVWAHAALLYLFVVVSGWQPASADVRYHVRQIIQLLVHQLSSPSMLRTVVWPFCVAGCLAEPAQESYLRGMVESLQPNGVYGSLHKALEIMENVWRERNVGSPSSRDLATCFRSKGEFVLLV